MITVIYIMKYEKYLYLRLVWRVKTFDKKPKQKETTLTYYYIMLYYYYVKNINIISKEMKYLFNKNKHM